MQNVIKKSLLCGSFSQKSKSLKCRIKWIAKYGQRFVKSEKIGFLTQRFSKIRLIKLAFFFSANLLSLSLITAIGKYIY